MRWYRSICCEILSDRVQIAVVQQNIGDEDLRCHVLMHAARFSSKTLVQEEVQSIIMARDVSGPAPMDVGAVYEGKGRGKEQGKTGKGKGKWKEKDKDNEAAANLDAGVICWYGHRKRHRKLETQSKRLPLMEMLTAAARISMIEMDDWILMVNADDHETQVKSTGRVDSGAAVSVCPLGVRL